MDWLQFFSSIVGSLAWPAAVVALTYMLKDQVGQLVKDIRTFEWDKLKVTIGDRIEQVSETVASMPDVAEPPDSSFDRLMAVSKIDPRAAVLTGWASVEQEMYDLMKRANLPSSRDFTDNLELLVHKKLLDLDTMTNMMSLRDIRNAAAHVNERLITPVSAAAMVETCSRVVKQLRHQAQPSNS
ncbi:DUF4145 domain-containing protein [Pseudomonas sp. B21-044]|uniref:DUF4145 domain-containing protein n=1 Tax=Pseudomonas sp. B21-044 TaxID=2895488 RepID=UPI0021606E6B|nr:DUF4145 domain-containing protein [Pseudomonas sp. B21-044]UVL19640.1 DUF4145 domain-containing protein [Pseudomonas sp. B21-044]